MRPSDDVISQARWAPSGDNTQVWRFADVADEAFTVIGHDLRHEMVYDIDGRPSRISLGALLESIRLAASTSGRRADIRHVGSHAEDPAWRVTLLPGASTDPLAYQLPRRCTTRTPFSTRPLSDEAWRALRASCPGLQLRCLSTWRERWRAARVCAAFARLRYASRECWLTHREVIDFADPSSRDRIPVESLGCNAIVRRAMRWSFVRWERQELLNRWCGGALLPSLQFDLLPTIRCGAFVVAIADRRDDALPAQLAIGAAFQRFWLTATALGLSLQPAFSPIIFADYARAGRCCFASPRLWRKAQRLAAVWDGLLDGSAERAVFALRIGHAPPPPARSGRLDAQHLMR